MCMKKHEHEPKKFELCTVYRDFCAKINVMCYNYKNKIKNKCALN